MPVLSLLPLIAAAAASAPIDSTWLDVESRIQYAYYTEDERTLKALASQSAAAASPPDGMGSYYSGLADYRLTQLESSKDKSSARDGADGCVSSLERAAKAANEAAEAHAGGLGKLRGDVLALQSACLRLRADLSPLHAPFDGPKSRSLLEKALLLAPRSPRVLFLDAVGAYEHAPNGADRDRALGKIKTAIAALESERQDIVHVPGWGLADAYTYLGRVYLDRGDTVAARDALEHALLAAPEFTQARRLMTKITSG